MSRRRLCRAIDAGDFSLAREILADLERRAMAPLADDSTARVRRRAPTAVELAARACGAGVSSVKALVRIQKLAPDVFAAVGAGKLTVEAAKRMVLGKANP